MKCTLNNIVERFTKNESLEFVFFWGHTVKDGITKACFSQCFPDKLEKNGSFTKTVEHYMMAGKAII